MGFVESIKTCFSKYIIAAGRASRSELWWFVLFVLVGSLVANWIDTAVFGAATMFTGNMSFTFSSGVVGSIFTLAVFLPVLAVEIRRLHDLDKSGWWVLIGLIPMIGTIVLLVWFVGKGTTGDNRFGPDPLA